MSETSITQLVGRRVVSVRGERLGKIDRLVTQGDDREPVWALVKRLFGLRAALVPLEHANDDDGVVRLKEEREWVTTAPGVPLEGEHISAEDADVLRDHYGLERLTTPTVSEQAQVELPRETREAKPPAMEEGDGSPLAKRRRERAAELGIPSSESHDDQRGAEHTGGRPDPES